MFSPAKPCEAQEKQPNPAINGTHVRTGAFANPAATMPMWGQPPSGVRPRRLLSRQPLSLSRPPTPLLPRFRRCNPSALQHPVTPVIDVLVLGLYPPLKLNGEINREPYLFPQKFHSHLDDDRGRPRRWKATRFVHAGVNTRLPGGGLSREPEPHVIASTGGSTSEGAAGAAQNRGASRSRLPDCDRGRPQKL